MQTNLTLNEVVVNGRNYIYIDDMEDFQYIFREAEEQMEPVIASSLYNFSDIEI